MEQIKARRYNKGKNRLGLIPINPLEELGWVYTKGAHKYSIYRDKEGKEWRGSEITLEEASEMEIVDDGANNWKKGLRWSGMIDSIDRHWAAFKRGEDVDLDLGTPHIMNMAWGLFSLQEFYKTHPELDDRPHSYLTQKRIGVDIDDVLANWLEPFSKLVDIEVPKMWNFGYTDYVNKLLEEGFDYKEFMLNLPVKTNPDDIAFEPICYITNRTHTDLSVAEEWLNKNKFPKAKIIQTADKISAAKEMNLDIFVDDKFDTFVAMNNADIMCYLFDAPHNQRYNVGHKRLYSLKDLK